MTSLYTFTRLIWEHEQLTLIAGARDVVSIKEFKINSLFPEIVVRPIDNFTFEGKLGYRNNIVCTLLFALRLLI